MVHCVDVCFCNVGLLVSLYCYCIAVVHCLFTVKPATVTG